MMLPLLPPVATNKLLESRFGLACFHLYIVGVSGCKFGISQIVLQHEVGVSKMCRCTLTVVD